MSTYLPDIDPERVPAHVAIVMDGNGRWASSAACRGPRATRPARRRCWTRSKGGVEVGLGG